MTAEWVRTTLSVPVIALAIGSTLLPRLTIVGSAQGSTAPRAGNWKYSYAASYEDDNIEIHVVPVNRPARRDAIIIHEKGKLPEQLGIPLQVGQVASITKVTPTRFLLILNSPAPYSGILLLDLPSRSFIEAFSCYDPILSPNHRFLAFKKFYPPHFNELPEETSDFELLYDFSKDPKDNLDPGRLVPGQYPVEESTSGILIFPKNWTVDHVSGNIDKKIIFNFPTFFFWSSDSEKLVFLAEHYPSGAFLGDEQPGGNILPSTNIADFATTDVVLVDVSKDRPTTWVYNSRECAPASGETCGITMTNVVFEQSGINVTLHRTLPVKFDTVVKAIKYPKFLHLK